MLLFSLPDSTFVKYRHKFSNNSVIIRIFAKKF